MYEVYYKNMNFFPKFNVLPIENFHGALHPALAMEPAMFMKQTPELKKNLL